MKRENYLTWDEYFMGLAKLSAMRSKDPNTTVGACIVDKHHKILSMGYNGAPIGYKDDELPWNRDGNFVDSKYAYVCHSELNAILNARGIDLTNSIIYVTLFPCNECAKAIIQSGISKVIYESDKYNGTDENIVAKKLFDKCGVEYIQYKQSNKNINMSL